MPYLRKPEGRYDVSGMHAELRKADAALDKADAKLQKENRNGAITALKKAVKHFNGAIELSLQIDFGDKRGETLGRLYYYRGRAAALLNKVESGSANMDEAIADLVKSAELNPTAEIYLRLGEAYAQAGDLDAAIESLHQSIRIDANFVDAHVLMQLIDEERSGGKIVRYTEPVVF